MFKRMPKSEWKQREDIRLRVARLRVEMKTLHGHSGSAPKVRSLFRRRPVGSRFRRKAAPGLLGRLLSFGRSGRI
jgi:hypothetical protein